MAILAHEIRNKIDGMKRCYDTEGIALILSKIFQTTANELLGAMNSPIKSDPLSILSIIQETEVGAGFEIDTKIPILNLDAFTDIIENESLHITIFNTMIFDCVNDSLDRLVNKIELPWSNERNIRKIYESVSTIQESVEKRIFSFNDVKAGNIMNENSNENKYINEQIAIQNREKGVIKILSYEINENDHEWINYENEEVQAKLDLADMVLEMEIEEIIEIIIKQ